MGNRLTVKSVNLGSASLTAVLVAIFLSGCMPHIAPQQIAVTPQLEHQLGLPLYPNAKPISAQEFTPPGAAARTTTVIMFQTTDDPSKVESFYLKRLPPSTRKMSMSLGFVKPELLQYFDAHEVKQVSIMSMMGSTMIQLQSTPLKRTPPSP